MQGGVKPHYGRMNNLQNGFDDVAYKDSKNEFNGRLRVHKILENPPCAPKCMYNDDESSFYIENDLSLSFSQKESLGNIASLENTETTKIGSFYNKINMNNQSFNKRFIQ